MKDIWQLILQAPLLVSVVYVVAQTFNQLCPELITKLLA